MSQLPAHVLQAGSSSGSTLGHTTSRPQSGYEHKNKFNVQKKATHLGTDGTSGPAGNALQPLAVPLPAVLRPQVQVKGASRLCPVWAGTAGTSLMSHRPPQRGLMEESMWEGPTGSSFQPLSVEDDLFVLGVGNLPTCLEPPDGLPHVLGLQWGQLPPLLTHIQSWTNRERSWQGQLSSAHPLLLPCPLKGTGNIGV